MKINISYQVELNDEEMQLADELNAGDNMKDISARRNLTPQQGFQLRKKLFKKLFVTDVLGLYKITHSTCAHCGKDSEHVALRNRVEPKNK